MYGIYKYTHKFEKQSKQVLNICKKRKHQAFVCAGGILNETD